MRFALAFSAMLALGACAYNTTVEQRPERDGIPAQTCETKRVKALFFFKSTTTDCQPANQAAK